MPIPRVLAPSFICMCMCTLCATVSEGQNPKAIIREQAKTETGPQEPYLRVNTSGHAAQVRALCFIDSTRLCTAGFDKQVHVWRLSGSGAPDDSWTRERTLYWEAGLGPRGQIYAMAAPGGTGEVVIAGFGNRSETGEIISVKINNGQYAHTEYARDGGHRESVSGLAISANGEWLASHSQNGEILLRRRGAKPFSLVQKSGEFRELAPIAILGNGHVALPTYAGKRGRVPVWRVKLFDIDRSVHESPLEGELKGAITALAASSDGRYLAAADAAFNLMLWDFNAGASPKPRSLLRRDAAPKRLVMSLAFGRQGGILAAGTYATANNRTNELLKWDLQDLDMVQVSQASNPIWACAISPDDKLVAYVDGKDVLVQSLDQRRGPARLRGGDGIAQVAFASGAPEYAVSFLRSSGVAQTFNAKRQRLTPGRLAGSSNPPRGATVQQDLSKGTLTARSGRSSWEIPFGRQTHGVMTCHTWIMDDRGRPSKLVVGTEAALACLYVFDLKNRGPRSPERQFVGHTDRVNSVDVSTDNRYAVTGSDDGTIRYWKLEPPPNASRLLERWGIELQERSGKLVVQTCLDTGPLFYKRLRKGDEITGIQWDDDGKVAAASNPAEIRRRLEQLPWNTQIVFSTSRDGKQRQPVQELSAWKHLLAMFPTDPDWIAWNPIGYYTCSAGGERLMGWQVSNELGRAPSFYAAAQFAKTLFQPKLIGALLANGSLSAARPTGVDRNQMGSISNPAEIRPPLVTIVSPVLEPGETEKKIATAQIRIEADAISRDYPLVSMRLLLNGRPYQERQKAKGIVRDRMAKSAVWQIDLPPGRNTLQVLADIDVSQGDSQQHLVQGKSDPLIVEYDAKSTLPSLYVVAIGIAEYPDHPGYKPLTLDYADSDADSFAATVNDHSQPLFNEVHVIPLVNKDATTKKILEAFAELEARARPEDVVIVFYSGHGVLANDQFYLLSVDGKPGDIPGTCVSEVAIKQFCESTSGRLVLLVDACHSGAFRGENMVRELLRDDYGVIVMASSRGDEVSLEDANWQAGAFTKALNEGLEGMADYNRDGFVLNIEVDSYVYNRVFDLTKGKQNPVSFKPTTVTPFRLTRP